MNIYKGHSLLNMARQMHTFVIARSNITEIEADSGNRVTSSLLSNRHVTYVSFDVITQIKADSGKRYTCYAMKYPRKYRLASTRRRSYLAASRWVDFAKYFYRIYIKIHAYAYVHVHV